MAGAQRRLRRPACGARHTRRASRPYRRHPCQWRRARFTRGRIGRRTAGSTASRGFPWADRHGVRLAGGTFWPDGVARWVGARQDGGAAAPLRPVHQRAGEADMPAARPGSGRHGARM